jgi:chromosome segregation protein
VGVGAPADRSLADLVSVSDPRFAPMVRRWLGQCAPVDEAPAAGDLDRIPAGWLWVDPSGTLYERGAVRFYAGPAGEANILVRKREIEALAEQVQGHAAQLDAARGVREQAEQRYAAEQARLRELQAHRAQEREARHRIEIDLTGLKQRRQAALTRAAEIEGELEQLAGEHAQLSGRFEGYGSAIEAHERALAQAQEHLGQVHLAQQQAERLIAAQRSVVRAAELHEQEVRFAAREAQSKLDEIRRTLHGLQAQIATTTASEHRLREELAGLEEGDLREQLQRGLEARVAIERRLSDAREALESAHAQLRQAEEGRLQAEQEIGPLRERSAELRLQQQAARLALEQFSEQLLEARADEAAIEQAYQQGRAVRPQALQNDITRLGNQMNALGPINMAALQELATSRERKEYLDAQSADLAEALSTLENAIRKIDLETRSLLQETFDTVNRNFSAMFPSLFGGGQARLEMTGEEILDAGVQVLAQPPGKRNVSVHLLSGGEKALTAISLVFSLFQLNPAPFCMLDEVDAPLDDSNTGRFCDLVKKMSGETQFVFISHNKLTMEIANQLIGVTMQEQGVSRIVAVDIDEAMKLREAA